MIHNYFSSRAAWTGGATFILVVLALVAFRRFDDSSPINLASKTFAHNSFQNVANETLGFQKIFVINLPSRTDHRDRTSLAAALSGFQVEYVDGVTEWDETLLPFPKGENVERPSEGNVGAWRAHMNAIRMIVEQNITSALVLEGDVDWDIRIKSQLQEFAKASQLLLRPHHQEDRIDLRAPMAPGRSDSPYGPTDLWDLLWLGHCGAMFPTAEDNIKVPLGRVVMKDDETVPEPQHIDIEYGNSDLLAEYPPHTRVVSWARENVCTLAYGISQLGARRFLYDVGIRSLNANTDIMFRQMCDGLKDRKTHSCLTVQPQLFQHHRPVGERTKNSGISSHGSEYNAHPYTKNIRWSTQMNLDKLVNGETDYVDLFPDGKPGQKYGP